MKVFIDTGVWIALKDRDDRDHDKAKKHLQFLKKKRALLFCNDYILAETYTRFIYDFGLNEAISFNQSVVEGADLNLTVIEVNEGARQSAWRLLRKYADHKLSFADATAAVSFLDYQMDEIFTFDGHFRDINLPTNLG
ncbi:MAG: nucleic acid-binding protein, contains PIN domain [Microgenomates group bacterium Gr01-1014_16]|nr:MAG: nucleic acid-binding protein, contains PIN domain [Microgenomates group bacterium Gr01-1014_16]